MGVYGVSRDLRGFMGFTGFSGGGFFFEGNKAGGVKCP